MGVTKDARSSTHPEAGPDYGWEAPSTVAQPTPRPVAALGSVGTYSRREVGEHLTLLNSRPASKEGSCMDPARLPHAPHPLAPDSQEPCGKTQ